MGKSQSVLFSSEYSLNELSKKSGISVGYLSLIFNGKRTNVSLAVLTRLGYTLDLSVAEVRQLIQKSVKNATAKNQAAMADPQKEKQEEQEKRIKDIIQCVIQCLEHYDPIQLEKLKRDAAEGLEESPLKYRLLQWIEGIQAARHNQFTLALGYLMEARMFRAGNPQEKRMLAKIYGGLGSCYTALGDRKMGFKMFAKSLNIWGRGPDAALIYLNMGTLYRRSRQYHYANQAYTQAIEMGSFFIQIMACSGLGQVALDQEDLERARVILLRGYVLSKKRPCTWGVPELYCNLGTLYKLSQKLSKANYILNKAEMIAEELGAVRVKHFIMIEQGEVLLHLHKVQEANQVFARLEKELRNDGDIFLVSQALISAAKLLWDNSPQIALECLQRCYRILSQMELGSELLSCCQLLVDYYSNKQDLGEYDFYKEELRRIKRQLEDKKQLALNGI